MFVTILGIRVHAFTYQQALVRARDFLFDGGQHSIFTPNPEMLVKAQKDEYFKKVLNSGELNICDGMGLWMAMKYEVADRKYKVSNKIERIPGTDFMVDICRVAEQEGKSVYLLGSGSDEVIKKTKENLEKQFPGLRIIGFDKGLALDERYPTLSPSLGGGEEGVFTGLEFDTNENEKIIAKINATKPDIVFVAFGMGKQEKWIYENLNKMPSVRIAMGVGGAFDYLSGKVSRAPLLMRKIGLEWLYRLVKQPWRAGRIFNATVRFVYLFLRRYV